MLAAYVRARVADASGDPGAAARGYGVALAARPGDPTIAVRAYRQALNAGDFALASTAARVLDDAAVLPADGRLLLLAQAIQRRDWAAGRALTDAIARDGSFDFLVPTIRAWLADGAGDADPIAVLDAPTASPLSGAMATEHRALLLLKAGRIDEGVLAARSTGLVGGTDGLPVRLTAAARLVKAGRRDSALALLRGEEPAIMAARAHIESSRAFTGTVTTPAQGIALLYLRVSAAMEGDRASPLSLTLARLAALLDPESDLARLAVARQMASAGESGEAVTLLTRTPVAGPYAADIADARIDLLIRSGERERALEAALAASAKAPATLSDEVRIGDLLSGLDRYKEAAAAYDRALALAGPDTADRTWTLWLMKGGALERAGDWAAARPALKKAVELAPDQAIALNYLGYAQLERREDIPAATALIAKASALRPDDPAIADSLGWAHFLAGDLARAIPQLELALSRLPADPTINEHLGDAYWTAGRRYEARYAWRAAAVVADEAESGRITAKLANGLASAVPAP